MTPAQIAIAERGLADARAYAEGRPHHRQRRKPRHCRKHRRKRV